MVVDLIEDDGKFSFLKKLWQNLSSVNFLEWYDILHSIPRE